jgi:hypothetical protein
VGSLSGASQFTPVDASALGLDRPGSVALFAGFDGLKLGAGVGLGDGALRAYGGGHTGGFEVGAGYAATFVRHDAASALHMTVGGQLMSAFRHLSSPSLDAGSLNLTIPLAITAGDPKGGSIGVYAAPFAETGIGRHGVSNGCPQACNFGLSDATRMDAAGIGAGVRASVGRFAFNAYIPARYALTLGLTLGVGR